MSPERTRVTPPLVRKGSSQDRHNLARLVFSQSPRVKAVENSIERLSYNLSVVALSYGEASRLKSVLAELTQRDKELRQRRLRRAMRARRCTIKGGPFSRGRNVTR